MDVHLYARLLDLKDRRYSLASLLRFVVTILRRQALKYAGRVERQAEMMANGILVDVQTPTYANVSCVELVVGRNPIYA